MLTIPILRFATWHIRAAVVHRSLRYPCVCMVRLDPRVRVSPSCG